MMNRYRYPSRARVLLTAVVFVLWPAMAGAAVDRERSQRFYEEALQHYKDDGLPAAAIQLRNALQQNPKNLPARILLGETLLREDQPEAAVKELEMALSLGGDENLILVPLARAFMELAQPERVITGIVPNGHEPAVDGELHILQGSAYAMLGNAKLAEQSYLAAGVLLPVDPRPLIERAKLELGRGKKGKADKLLNQAIGLAPDSFDVWLFKALAHRDLGQPRPALAAFAKALELRPTSDRALAARAALWMDLGESEKAREDLDKARDLGLNSLETIYLRTLLLFREGKAEEGRELLRESADDIRSIKDEVRQKLTNTALMLGVVAYFEENYEEAVAQLTTYLKRVPGHPGAMRYLTASYIGLGEWQRAIRVYRPSPNTPLPRDPSALSMLAEAYRSKGDYKSAERHYEAAFEVAPNLAGLGIRLAMTRLDAGKPEEALKELSWFVEKFPFLPEAQIQLARVYVKLERMDEAIKTIRALLGQHADDAGVHNVAGAIFLAAGETAAARDELGLATAIDPELILPRLNLARLDQLEGNTASAEVQYRALLDMHPFHVDAGLELAQILLDQGESREAGERIAKVLEVKPDSFEAHSLKLQAFLSQGEDRDRVRNSVYEFVKRFQEEPRAAFTAGNIYAALGDVDDAKVQYRHAVQDAQFDADLLTSVALAQLDIKDLSGALWSLTKALQGNPASLKAAILKTEVLIRLEDFDNARSILEAAVARHGETPALQVKRGDLRMAEGAIDEAVGLYREAYQVAPNSLTARTLFGALIANDADDEGFAMMKSWLDDHPSDGLSKTLYAEALMRRERFRDARIEYESLRAAGNESVVLLNNLAMIYLALGDPQAVEAAKRAHELAPDAWGVLDTYGWVLTQNEKPKEGLAMLREAFARSSTSPEVRYHIGVALMKLGRNAAARDELQAALDEGRPFLGDDDARKRIDELRVLLADGG